MCEVVVGASCLLSSKKKNETLHDVDMILWMPLFLYVVMHYNFPVKYPVQTGIYYNQNILIVPDGQK